MNIPKNTPVGVKFSCGPGVTMRIRHEACQFEFTFVKQVEVEAEERCGQPVKKTGNKRGTTVTYETLQSCSQDIEDDADKADNDLVRALQGE